MTEKELQRSVIKEARRCGWLVAHFGASVKIVVDKKGTRTVGDRDAAGFPDLVLLRGRELIFAELKGHSGWGLTFSQREWLDKLDDIKRATYDVDLDTFVVDVQVWTPEDLDVIYRRLR